MRTKHYRSKEEMTAAVAREVEELNGEIDKLRMALEQIDPQLKVSGDRGNSANDLRLQKEPSQASLS